MLTYSEFTERCDDFENLSRLEIDEIAIPLAQTYTEKLLSALHRVEAPIGVIILGRPNVGKTALMRKLFVEAIGIERYGEYFEKFIRSKDQPDVTKHIARLPYGTGAKGQEKGIILYDLPGLGADVREADNMVRVALGMPQLPFRDSDIEWFDEDYPLKTEQQGKVLAAVPFYDFSQAPEEHNAPAQVERKMMPVDEVTKTINDRELTCIYIVKGSEDRLAPELLEEDVNYLRERFEDKVIFVKTFQDGFDTWDQPRIKRRYQELEALLGEKAIWVNGATGEGVGKLAHEVLVLHGYQSKIPPYLGIELKCQRLFSASQEIPGLIIPAAFSHALGAKAATELTPVLSFLSQFVIHVMYTKKPSKDPGIQAVEESLQQFAEALKESEVKSKTEVLSLRQTLWERFQSFFTTLPVVKRVEFQYESLSRTPDALAKFYYWVYTLIYDREKQEDNCIIKAPMVPETQGVNWFVDQFRPYEQLFSEDEDPWELYRSVGADALTKFWEAHHPEVLPVYKPAHVREES